MAFRQNKNVEADFFFKYYILFICILCDESCIIKKKKIIKFIKTPDNEDHSYLPIQCNDKYDLAIGFCPDSTGQNIEKTVKRIRRATDKSPSGRGRLT